MNALFLWHCPAFCRHLRTSRDATVAYMPESRFEEQVQHRERRIVATTNTPLYWDNGKENGNYRDYRDYIGFI